MSIDRREAPRLDFAIERLEWLVLALFGSAVLLLYLARLGSELGVRRLAAPAAVCRHGQTVAHGDTVADRFNDGRSQAREQGQALVDPHERALCRARRLNGYRPPARSAHEERRDHQRDGQSGGQRDDAARPSLRVGGRGRRPTRRRSPCSFAFDPRPNTLGEAVAGLKYGRCNIGPMYVCKDVPVFTAAQLKAPATTRLETPRREHRGSVMVPIEDREHERRFRLRGASSSVRESHGQIVELKRGDGIRETHICPSDTDT